MKTASKYRLAIGIVCLLSLAALGFAEGPSAPPKAFVDGTGPGWEPLGEPDFVNVNCDPKTWTWEDGAAHCTGQPVGVTRTRKTYTNFEMVAQWRHLKPGGNSGIFVWATDES